MIDTVARDDEVGVAGGQDHPRSEEGVPLGVWLDDAGVGGLEY